MDKFSKQILKYQLEILIKSGFAGINDQGMTVDRRIFQTATPISKNQVFGIPTPKPLGDERAYENITPFA